MHLRGLNQTQARITKRIDIYTSIKILSGKLAWINPDKEKAKHSRIHPKHILYLLKCGSKLSFEILEKSWHILVILKK